MNQGSNNTPNFYLASANTLNATGNSSISPRPMPSGNIQVQQMIKNHKNNVNMFPHFGHD